MTWLIKNILNGLLPAGLLVMALSYSSCYDSKPSFKGTELPEDMPNVDFTLWNQHGEPFTLSEHQGKVVLLFFGYTYCPDVCPLTLSTWKKVLDALEEQAQQVAFVYITVDPERDTKERLKKHLAIFSPDFIGLTGAPDSLLTVYNAYGVYREKEIISESAAGYLVNHTSRINVVDRRGRWRLTFSHDAAAADIVHDIRMLLKP